MVFSGNLTLCVDARVLSEYREVLARPKFGFDRGKVAAIHDYIGRNGRIVASASFCLSLPDPDDGLFVEIAIAGGADFLVTGNLAHFPPGSCPGAKAVSPSDFLKRCVRRRKKK